MNVKGTNEDGIPDIFNRCCLKMTHPQFFVNERSVYTSLYRIFSSHDDKKEKDKQGDSLSRSMDLGSV